MQCKDIKVGQRFTSNGVTMTCIDGRVFAPLLGHRGLDTHTFDIHVFAVDGNNQLHAPHRENSCEPAEVRELNTFHYRTAPGGDGPLAATWKDKPHRLVYDLCNEIEQLREIDHESALVNAIHLLPIHRLTELLAGTLADRAASETSQQHFNAAVFLDDTSRFIAETYSESVEQ